jgi:hypothetical protein
MSLYYFKQAKKNSKIEFAPTIWQPSQEIFLFYARNNNKYCEQFWIY